MVLRRRVTARPKKNRSNRWQSAVNVANAWKPRFEILEDRVVLSTTSSSLVAVSPFAASTAPGIESPQYVLFNSGTTAQPQWQVSSSPFAYSTQNIRDAYALQSIQGDGTGQTIAIVDAYDDPRLVSSTSINFGASDLNQFDFGMNIANLPGFTFTKVAQDGSTNYPGTDPAGPVTAGSLTGDWEIEESLDVEWAHASTRREHSVVEANDASTANLFAAVNYAASVPGVTVVSMSWGGAEFAGETALDSTFTTPTGHVGITFLAATGDQGVGSYPAYSPNVVAVGGTVLQAPGGQYNIEQGWSGSGGGISQLKRSPLTRTRSPLRSAPASARLPTCRWMPEPASTFTIPTITSASETRGLASAGRVFPPRFGQGSSPSRIRFAFKTTGLSPWTAPPQTLPYLYSFPIGGVDFHDVLTGSNKSFTAGVGYDLVTGRGTPIGNNLVQDLSAATTALANQPPTLAPIANPAPILVNAGLQTVALSGIMPGLLRNLGRSSRSPPRRAILA